MRAWKPVYTQVREGECVCLCVTESENGNMHQLEGPIKSKWNPDTIQSSLLPHYLTVCFQEFVETLLFPGFSNNFFSWNLFDSGLFTSVNLFPSLLMLHSFGAFPLTLKLQALKLWINVLNKLPYISKNIFKPAWCGILGYARKAYPAKLQWKRFIHIYRSHVFVEQ